MKRFFKIFIIFLLVFSVCSGLCEGSFFSFRNGVMFGDSKESVKAKENMDPFVEQDVLLYSQLTLSGIEGSNLYYSFDNDGLKSISISYHSRPAPLFSNARCYGINEEILLRDFKTIEDGLFRKYGNPVENMADCVHYPGGAISIINDNREIDFSTIQGNQWIVGIEDLKQVVIEHVCSIKPAKHILTYQYIDLNSSFEDIVDNDL